ncbi:MAG: efflux RND transporter periplasmic adaptor subunit, partial [Pirellulales bacterium]|nr:efflux RND transporter periplasmic adaptor subunit [Pirellulales bacterium]
ADHAEATMIELSEKALKNIGYHPIEVALGSFERTVTMPAIVVEQPGRSQVYVTSPITGVVSEIRVTLGQAVESGNTIFRVRLIGEDLVGSQREYLRAVETLDVVNREIQRLEGLGEGVIAGKRVIEQKYEQQKLEATLRATEEALRLHGFNEEQVKEIRTSRKLLQEVLVRSPDHVHEEGSVPRDHLFHVQRLPVSVGQQVEAGQELCVLADHYELLLEGQAFEGDAARLREAARQGWEVTARLLGGGEGKEEVRGLKLIHLADHVDKETRAFRFYLRLPNEVVLDQGQPGGPRYMEWRYKPWQRVELRVPVERWAERIVLPVDGLVEEGAETYVYRREGTHFDRVAVHVEYRDRQSVVIANDGTLSPGDMVAGRGAYQVHLALKNKSGGGVDPHPGHHH